MRKRPERGKILLASSTLVLLLGACGKAPSTPVATAPSASQTSVGSNVSTGNVSSVVDNSIKGWRSYYYTEDRSFSPLSTLENQDVHKPTWSFDTTSLQGHNLSATWAARFSPLESGVYAFDIKGVANPIMYVDGKLVKVGDQSIELFANKNYWIQISAENISPDGDMHILWKKGDAGFSEVSANLFDPYIAQRNNSKPQSLGLNEPINLNPSFENGLKDWVIANVPLDSLTIVQPGYNSLNAIEIKRATIDWWPQNYDNVIPGAKYRLELKYKTKNAQSCYLGSKSPTSIFQQVGSFTTVVKDFVLPPNALSLPLPAVFSDGFGSQGLNIGSLGSGDASCIFDDAKITRIADPVPVEPAKNLLKNGSMDPDPQKPDFPVSWIQLPTTSYYQNNTVNLVPSKVPNSGTAVSFGRLKQTIPAKFLKPNTEYVLRFDMQGHYSECQIALMNGDKWLYGLDGRDFYNYKDIFGVYKTGATVSDIDVELHGSRCYADNVRFGPVNAADIIKDENNNSENMEHTIGNLGQNGGTITSSGVIISAEPGELSSDYTFNIQNFKETLSNITAMTQFVRAYHIDVKGQGNIFPLPIKFLTDNNEDDDYLYELYEKVDNSYKLIEFSRDSKWIEFYPEIPMEGSFSLDKNYILVRERISELASSFASTGGRFNGFYGECPSDMRALFGKCIKRDILASPLQIVDKPIILLSVNAGNMSPACGKYNYKLCKVSIEKHLREDIIQPNFPDLISIQEVFPEDCNDPDGNTIKDERPDYICSTIKPLGTQLERLIGPKDSQGFYTIVDSTGRIKKFTVECAAKQDGAYECIAINSEKFSIDAPSKPVQYLSGNSYKNAKDYCVKDDTLGRDTGFLARSIKVLGNLGKVNVSFDFVDAHLATPSNPGNVICRHQQLEALQTAFKDSGRKLLIAGDFNINYKYFSAEQDQKTLMALTSKINTPIEFYPAVKLGYMISNQEEFTTIAGKGLDHVISNFSDIKESLPCRRIGYNSLMVDHLSTFCSLYGFDTGQVGMIFQVLDTETGETSNVAPFVSVRRKGVIIPGSRWTLNSPSLVTLPDNISSYVEFSLNCPTSLPVGKISLATAGNQSYNGILSAYAYRSWCPW